MAINPSEIDLDLFNYSIQPKSFEIKDDQGNKQKMSYISIVITYDGSSEYFIQAPKMFSFGVKRSTFGGKPKYSTSFVMKDKDGATPEQQVFYDVVTKFVEKTKIWMIAHKLELKTPNLAENMLESLSPIYVKLDEKTGLPVDNYAPSLNANLKQKRDKICTDFYEEKAPDADEDADDVAVDPYTLISSAADKKFFTMTEGAITFPDVYFAKGKTPKIHCTLEEATVQTKKERTQRLTGGGGKRKTLFKPTSVSTSNSSLPAAASSDNDEFDLEEHSNPKPPPSSPVVEKKVEKKVEKVVEKKKVESDDEDDDAKSSDSEEEDDVPKKVVKPAPKGIPRRAK